MARIVVGVDGSQNGKRAMQRALEEARLRGADLEVVYAVPEPLEFADEAVPDESRDELAEEGLALIEKELAGVDLGDVKVARTAKVGQPAHVLCEAATGADMLVVGSRGLGGFRGLLVGSVTHQVVSHARCPVLIVVPEDR